MLAASDGVAWASAGAAIAVTARMSRVESRMRRFITREL
jgi:hypothetical protein